MCSMQPKVYISFVEHTKTFSVMETVDQSPELHLEQIQLRSRDPADMETPGQGLAAASPETPGVKDGHTPSPTLESEAERTSTARRVVYYALCILIVVAVWSVALLPSVLTFSILRSPVQVIQVQTRILFGSTKLHCYILSLYWRELRLGQAN